AAESCAGRYSDGDVSANSAHRRKRTQSPLWIFARTSVSRRKLVVDLANGMSGDHYRDDAIVETPPAGSLTRTEILLAAIASVAPCGFTQTTTVYTPGPSRNGTTNAKLPSRAMGKSPRPPSA